MNAFLLKYINNLGYSIYINKTFTLIHIHSLFLTIHLNYIEFKIVITCNDITADYQTNIYKIVFNFIRARDLNFNWKCKKMRQYESAIHHCY